MNSLSTTDSIRVSDPYSTWLEIPPGERPPDPYTLLRIARFESNEKLILAGRDRQIRALQFIKANAPQDLWAQLHREVQQACNRLLGARSRRLIDARLKREDMRLGKGVVPHTPHSPTVECPCGRTTSSSSAFCGGCGTVLWTRCCQCDHAVGIDEIFCGGCGAKLAEAFEKTLGAAMEQLQNGRRALEEQQFQAARDSLYLAAIQEDNRLGEIADEAAALLDRIEQQESEAASQAQQTLEQAQAAFDRCDYETAVQILEDLPRQLLTKPHVKLKQQAQAAREQVERLLAEVRELVQQKNLNGVGVRVEQLLVLAPHNQLVNQFAKRLAEQMGTRAKKLLERGELAKARAMLREVPTGEMTPLVRQIQSQIDEVLWLADRTRTTPLVDDALPGLLDRLSDALPDGEAQVAPLKQRLGSLAWGSPWRKADAQAVAMHVGVPLSPQRWNLDTLPRRDQWERKCSLFGVALGLGLQGLDRAVCQFNLSDAKPRSVLGRWIGKEKPPSAVWAVDLGEYSLKALQLRIGEDERIEIIDWLHEEHGADQAGLDGEQRNQRLAECLAKLRDRIDGEARVVASISGRHFIVRRRRMPIAKDKKTMLAIENVAKEMIPLDLDQLVWRSHQFPNFEDLPGVETNIIAVRRSELERQQAHFERAGMEVERLQADFVALYNLAASETMAAPPTANDQAALLIEFGHEGVQLVLAGPDFFLHRHIRVGGKSISEAIAQSFQTTWATSEKIKRNPLLVKSLSKLYGVVEPRWDLLFAELRKSLEAGKREFGKLHIGGVHALGGGFMQHGALRALHQFEVSPS